jgi:ATP-dependent Clp protease ATP-binding subunit ClpA
MVLGGLRCVCRRHYNEKTASCVRSILVMSSYSHYARLSELSRRVLNAAAQLAFSLDHANVGIGHLLLMMAQETRSPTSPMLLACGLDETRLRDGLAHGDDLLLVSIDPVLGQLRDLVEQAGSHYTGTEHLLLAIVHDPAGQAALHAYGVRLELLERQLQVK